MEILDIHDVSLHKLTETHPKMNQEQFLALTKDIEKKGQLQPVLLYRGKIVDGRHRFLALTALNIGTIKATSIPNNLSLDEVAKVVDSTEMRRHQSPTQLAIKAYRLYKATDMTRTESIARTGCSLSNLKLVLALDKLGRLDVIDNLEKGVKFDVSDDSRFTKLTDSLLAIVNSIKASNAKLEALAIKSEVDTEEYQQNVNYSLIDAILVLTKSLSEYEKKVLIAKLYNQ